jgi:cytochrome P450
MIGAPNRDIHRFREWAVAINNLFALGGRISLEAARSAQDCLGEMRQYIAELSQFKKAQPGDDILSRLLSAEADEERLTIDELVSTCVTLFVAGHETTTNLIGNGTLALLQHPEQVQLLRETPAMMPQAVEEMLRYDPSVPRGWRIAKQDVELGGETIGQGSLVFPILAAANRDPDAFPQPNRFDIQREMNKHVAFGHGIHYCLGAPLARVEGAVAMQSLLQRFPNLHLSTDSLTWKHDVAIRSLESLPVAW